MDKIFQSMIGSLTLAQLDEMKEYIEREIRLKSGNGKMLNKEIEICKSKNADGYPRRIEAIKMVQRRLDLDLRGAKAIVDEECPIG
jgi:ribosomal protein L7/L12